MSKALEELETLKFLVDNYSNFEFDFAIIENALKRLGIYEDYQIDLTQEDEVEKLLELNGKITYVDKVLDTQERLMKSVSSDEIRILSSVFKSQLAKLRKKLKALDIIKERRVNLEYLKCCDTYEQYCLICSYANEITQEEFDLLKEVLL